MFIAGARSLLSKACVWLKPQGRDAKDRGSRSQQWGSRAENEQFERALTDATAWQVCVQQRPTRAVV